MHKIFLFSISVLCLFSLIYITTPETKAERQDKGKSRILNLIENKESAMLAKKTPGVSLSVQEISEIFVPVLIYTDDKNDTKSILDSGSIEKYKVFKHIDFVYAHINKSTLDALDLNSNTIFLFEDEIFDVPEPVFSTETIQPTTTLSSTYTGKGNVVAIIDSGIKSHPFINSNVTALDGSPVPRIVYQECHSKNDQVTNDDGVTYTTRSLCEDTDSNGAGDDAVIDQAKNPAMHCDTSITEGLKDCAHGLYVASAISGEKPALETASTPSPSAPDTQLAIYKISNGYSCNDGNDDPDDGCLDGLEFLSLATSSILSSIDSIIDRKKEYLNGDADGDAGLNIVSLNLSIGATTGFSSTECSSSPSSVKSSIYSNDSSKETLYNNNIAFVTSAGNSFQRNGEALYGCLPGALSVAALNSSGDKVAYFSNIAPYTDFIDNGEKVWVAAIDGGYEEASGTSFSSPKVAGLYSVLAQKYPDATAATVDELTKRLKTFATFFADTRAEYTSDDGVVTYPAAINTKEKFPQPNIEEALSGAPIISRSKIKDISTAYDDTSNTYSTTEDSLDIEFVSDTSRAYITSALGGHFTGEIDATGATDSTNGVTVFSVTIPIRNKITDTIFINTVDDLTTNDDIISTNLFIIQKDATAVSVQSVDTNTHTDDFDINVTFSEEVSNVDIGDFRLVLKGEDTSTASTLGTIVVEKHSDSTFSDISPSTTTDATTLSGTYFKVIVSPQDDLMTDIGVTEYAFQVINDKTNSIVNGSGGSLGVEGFSGVIRASEYISIDTAGPKTQFINPDTDGEITVTSTFAVNVLFTEAVENVGIGNFEITNGTDSSGVVESVTVYNASFTTPGDSTDTSTSLSGRYFRVSVKPIDEIFHQPTTFRVLPTSITDQHGNTFQTSTKDQTDLIVDTRTTPTAYMYLVDALTIPINTGDFEINVSFNEEVSNVDIGDFRLVSRFADAVDDDTFGTIVVEKHSDYTFTDENPITTDTTTTQLSGRYFKVKVSPQDDLMTDAGVTEYSFQVIDDTANSSSIVDADGNTLRKKTLDVIKRGSKYINIDTLHPKTESISLVTPDTQTSTFDVKVSFTETINNISVDNFDFTDGSTSVASITKVEVHSDSNFNDTDPSTTTDPSTLSGRYFKVSINPRDDINDTYTFKVLSTSITDQGGNSFQASTDDDTLDITVDTERAPTLDSISIVDALITPKNEDFDINVTFSEEVNNVDIGDFRLVSQGADSSTATTFGTIVVEKHSDSNFNDTSPTTTDTTTTQLSGTYFKIKVSPQDDLMTDAGVTEYVFQVIDDAENLSSIEDGASNPLGAQGFSGIIRATADISIDTTHPKAELTSLDAIGITQIGDFEINVTFSEEVGNVDIGDFRLVLKGADTSADTTLGTIVVEKHSDSTFSDTSPSTTTDATRLSGTYFKVKVSPQDDLMTDAGVTEYAFQVIDDTANSSSIVDADGNTLVTQGLSGIIRATADTSIDTTHPKTQFISADTDGEITVTSTFAVNVLFTEAVENVGIGNFEITNGTDSSGVVESVTVYNASFTTPGDSTDTSISLSGRYFRVSVKPIDEIAHHPATFKVLPTSITDQHGNTFQTSTKDQTDLIVDTRTTPTAYMYLVDALTIPINTGDFEINVSFNEEVSNVDIGDFRLVSRFADAVDDDTFGTIVVEKHSDYTFTDENPITTDTTTTQLSGRYFKVKVSPQDDLMTDAGVTEYEFQVIDDIANSSSIVDADGNTLRKKTLDVIKRGSRYINIDTLHPKTESTSLVTPGTQTTTFDVDVTFSESVNNVDISDFEFIEIDDTDPANTITSSVGTITKVEAHSYSSFSDTDPSTTTTTTDTLSGRYFKVSINPNEDINGTYTFAVLSTSITDQGGNSFQMSTNDTFDVVVNINRIPTLTSVSITNPSVTPKTEEFKINVVFSEVVYSVNIEDFQFTDGSTSVASITKVEVFDSAFNSSSISTTDTTEVSGQYFSVSIDPNDDLNSNGTPAVTYTFEVLSSEGIIDEASNSFDGMDGEATTLDVEVDTVTPLILDAEIVNKTLVLTSSISLKTSSVIGAGGFAVKGSDSTVYTVYSVAVSGTTITLTFAAGTNPKKRGTYSYTKNSTLTIQTSASNALAKIEGADYGPDFTLDFDGSKSFTAASDAFFLYLYTQNQDGGVDITDGVLGQSIFGGVNNVLATKAHVQDGIDGGYLDFDGSEDFTAASDAFFLYLYRQDEDGGVDITDGVLGQAIFGGVNNVPATKTRIDNYIQGIQNP